jgi:hypothetical protein
VISPSLLSLDPLNAPSALNPNRNPSKPTAGDSKKMHLTTRSLNNAASANGAEEMKNCLSTLLLRRYDSVIVRPNRSCPDITVTDPDMSVTDPVFRHERSFHCLSKLDPGTAKVSVLTIFKFKAIVQNFIS